VRRTVEDRIYEGELAGVDPPGSASRRAARSAYRIEDDRIAEEWLERDALDVMRGIRVVPGPDAT
jgi:predicted ester cyclase